MLAYARLRMLVRECEVEVVEEVEVRRGERHLPRRPPRRVLSLARCIRFHHGQPRFYSRDDIK